MTEEFQKQLQPREFNFSDIHKREFVGRGSFGTVYKARFHDQDVAVKEFDLNADRRSIKTEIKQLSRVEHPNIIAFYGISIHNSSIFLIMEFAEGGSLCNFLHDKAEPYYSAAHAMSWARQCANGVSYLHAMKPKALIHRDLKPPNLLLLNRGRILKICDFGTVTDKQTIMTNSMGSAAWMAPEVFATSSYTEKCDVFSWGIILWEMLTRQQPFQEIGDVFRIMWKVNDGIRPPKIEGCPKPIANLISSCWDQNPVNRPAMAEIVEIMTTLCGFCAGADIPLEYSCPIQQTTYELEETKQPPTPSDSTIVNDRSEFGTLSNTSEVTLTKSQSLHEVADLCLDQSTVAEKLSLLSIRSVSPVDTISEETKSQSLDIGDDDPFQMAPLAETVRRMETNRNRMLQEKVSPLKSLALEIEPNAWNFNHEDGRSVLGNISKSEGVTGTKTKSFLPDEDANEIFDGTAATDDDQSLHIMLDPELRPETPIPNNRISQEIYQEHTKLAKEYLRVDTELYYATDRRKKLLDTMGEEERENKHLLIKKTREKEELLEFYNDLQQQLKQIETNHRLHPESKTTSGQETGQSVIPEAGPDDERRRFHFQNHKS